MQKIKNEIYMKYCENLDYDVVIQKSDGMEKCLSSQHCANNGCSSAVTEQKCNRAAE